MQRFLESVPGHAGAPHRGRGRCRQDVAVAGGGGRAEAAGRGHRRAPDRGGDSFAYAALGDLLGPHPEVLGRSPVAQRRALEVALLVADRGEKPTSKPSRSPRSPRSECWPGQHCRGRRRRRAVARPVERGGARLRRPAHDRRARRPFSSRSGPRARRRCRSTSTGRRPAIASTASCWHRSASAPSSASSNTGSAGSPPARTSYHVHEGLRAGTRSSRSNRGGRYRRVRFSCSPASGSP